jgi:hypothetical protein
MLASDLVAYFVDIAFNYCESGRARGSGTGSDRCDLSQAFLMGGCASAA